MDAAQAVIRRIGAPGDLGWVVMAHAEQYTAEFGWDATFEAFVARIVADFAADNDPAREAGWIAELDGRRVGCVFCITDQDGAAKLRILFVDPVARGQRLGTRLVAECVEFARAAGYQKIKLWTNDVLATARAVYLAAGFRLVEEERHHSFGADLVGQFYELDLVGDDSGPGAAG